MTRQPDIPQTFLSPRQVAERCNISVKTVYRWIIRGDLIAYKLGEQWRIEQKDLTVFLKMRRQA